MNKKFLWIALFSGLSLSAQETGEAAVNSASIASSNNWQNWAFAGTAIVTASVGVFLVTLDSGANAH